MLDRRAVLMGAVGWTAAGWARAETALTDVDASAPETVRKVARSLVALPFGTGFLVGEGGLALTNDHVVRQSEGRRDARFRGRAVRWTVVRRVPAYDLAWIRIHPLRSAIVGPGVAVEPARVGTPVWSVGFAGSLSARWSSGRILRREQLGDVPLVVHSAQTWWGSSGSPLIDASGQVVAVHFGWDDNRVVGGGLLAVEPFRAGLP